MSVEPARILGVHGIRNHAAGASDRAAVARQRSEDWLSMLEKAFAGCPLHRPLDVRVTYFADLLQDESTVEHGPPTPQGPNLHLDEHTDDFLRELAAGWRARGPSAPPDDVTLLARTCGLRREELIWLARRHLRELTTYLTCESLRDEVKSRVHAELNEFKPDVVLGHDLGALVAYEALALPVQATSLITLGAPWGSRWVMNRLAQPGRSLTPPVNVTRWIDLYSNGDLFGVNRPVGVRIAGDPWQELCLDEDSPILVRHNEDHSHYLAHPQLGRHLSTCLTLPAASPQGTTTTENEWDFFVSYAEPDKSWAEWIAWALEDQGYRVLIEAWDFVAGTSRTARIHEGVVQAQRMIAVLSKAYLRSTTDSAEWQAMLSRDPRGNERRLITVRVENCAKPGLIDVGGCDLFDVSEPQARNTLLQCVEGAQRGRGKPTTPPPFPGGPKNS